MDHPKRDSRKPSDDLRSSKSVSPDDVFADWAEPIVACVRNFKGGTLIVNSAPFRDALLEAERNWVETNIDYKTEEEKPQNIKKGDQSRQELISELKSEIERLRLANLDLERERSAKVLPVLHPIEVTTARPENVAELLSEIYKIEWQPAFEFFIYKKKLREREATEELLTILKDCFEFCESLSSEHLRDLMDTLFVPTSNQNILKKIRIPKSTEQIDQQVSLELSRLRRSVNPQIAPIIEQMFFLTEKPHLKAHLKAVEVHPFIKLCLKCAWISTIQDRPLSVTFKMKPGSPFYPDVMISRNAPAPNVDYLVWPIVFLYDKGPLLLKGIVHCSLIERDRPLLSIKMK
ncbi:uncharacterized protein LOC133192354 [Saccostrea echinata]|uniref:uncharacterized protein LOC133192354 n=1 Tax=Saccostrea echinata TaxID=191078 RepID=UPI002A7EF24A|nr:uncharacterized protein LOC133192354 [Saccostrea echinata]